MTRYSCPSSVSLISWMVQMFGWSRAETAWASWGASAINCCCPALISF